MGGPALGNRGNVAFGSSTSFTADATGTRTTLSLQRRDERRGDKNISDQKTTAITSDKTLNNMFELFKDIVYFHECYFAVR